MKYLFALVSIVLFSSGCKEKDETLLPAPSDTIITTNEDLKHFGFTLIDTYWDDPLDSEEKSNYSDEVFTFSNMADLIPLGPDDDLRERIAHFDSLEMKAILHLNELFFEYVDTDAPSGARYALRPDYQARWDGFIATNDLAQDPSRLAALYIGEEPTWNGISFTQLSDACNYLKSTLPSIPIMMIEAYPALEAMQVPVAVDWLGFDHYFIADPRVDPVFQSEFEIIKSKRSRDDQQLVLILDAHYIDLGHGGLAGLSPADMKGVATSYYDLARTETDVVALIGYCWPGGFDLPDALGARQLPETVRAEYARIGKAITGKN